jgi:hypothetical protein
MVLFVLNAILKFVCLKSLVIVLVSVPTYVKIAHLFLLSCIGWCVFIMFYDNKGWPSSLGVRHGVNNPSP